MRISKLPAAVLGLLLIVTLMPMSAFASIRLMPVVTSDIPEQVVEQGDKIKTVTVSATDLTADQPLAASTEWTRNGGTSYTGLPTGLTLAPGSCTPVGGGESTCTWILAGSANVERGIYVITVYVTDRFGFTGSTDIEINVGNEPPVANAGGPYTVNEGESITLNGSGTDPEGDPLTYAWDLDNNGTYETAGQSVTFSAATLDGPTTATVGLQVCDDRGGCGTATAQINITNVAPVVTNDRPSQEVQAGQPIAVVTGTYSDVTVDFPLTVTTSWTLNGGAAQPGLPPGLAVAAPTCTPSGARTTCTISTQPGSTLAVGNYVVTVTVSDGDGGTATTQIAINVSETVQAKLFLPLIFK